MSVTNKFELAYANATTVKHKFIERATNWGLLFGSNLGGRQARGRSSSNGGELNSLKTTIAHSVAMEKSTYS